jgi:hypothetical protein
MGEQAKQRNFAAEQNRRAKEQDDLNKAAKDLSLPGNYKWHRLLADEAVQISAEAVNKLLEAKASGNPNWQNSVATIRNEFNQKMVKLVPLNESYNNFDIQTKQMNQTGGYTTENIQKAWQAFNEAADRKDLVKKMDQYGIINDRYFKFDPTEGYLDAIPPQKINLDDTIKKYSEVIPKTLIETQRVYNGKKWEERKVEQRPITKQQAEEYAKKYPDLNPNGAPQSLEDAVDVLMGNDEFVYQYASTNKLPYEDINTIKENLLNRMALNAGLNQTVKYGTQGSFSINVGVNTGIKDPGNKAEPNWSFDEFNGQPLYDASVKGGVAPSSTGMLSIGVYHPQLPIPPAKIPNSVYDSSGKRVNTVGKNAFVSTDKFGGFMIMPYFMKDGDAVPFSQATAGKYPVAGVKYFAQIIAGDNQDMYQDYDKFITSANAISGSDKEVTNLLEQAKSQMKTLRQSKYAVWSKIPLPTTSDWEAIKKYSSQVNQALVASE